MQFLKTSFLFLSVNIAVMLTLGVIVKVFQLEGVLNQYGVSYVPLLIFCLFYGMLGSFISLLLSKVMVKWQMRLRVIDPNRASSEELRIYRMVDELRQKAGLSVMPEVAIYEADEMNAFATGPSRSSALVAVSTGLLRRMDEKQVRGVLGHEIAHVANGDMVTMMLLQGVVNAFALFFAMVLSRIIAAALTRRDNENDHQSSSGLALMIEFLIRMVLQVVFMIVGNMIIAWFSRYREYRADAGGARFGGKQNMISALQALRDRQAPVKNVSEPSEANSLNLDTLKISTGESFLRLFSTHPPLQDRIARLQSSKSEV